MTDCGNCDNCRRPPQRFDGTILAQKAISAVCRTSGRLDIYQLVGLLRGIRRLDLVQPGFTELPTFGVGADLSKEEWMSYAMQMLHLGIFDMAYEDANRLKTTPFGMRVLRGREKVELAQYVPVKYRRNKYVETPKVPVDPVTELFEHLKAVRSGIAKEENMLPHLVFDDAALLDMARKRPSSIDSFILVEGVSEKKAVMFGRHFIREIRRFEGLSLTDKGSTYKETLVLFNSGCDVGEIAGIKKIKPATVYSHLAKLVEDGLVTDFRRLIDPRQYMEIIDICDSSPENAMEILSERYPKGLVPLALAIRRALERKNDNIKE